MIAFVDNVLNRVTMYRVMLYYLMFLLGAAVVLSAVGVLGYDPFALLFSIGFLLAVCSITNWIFAKAFHVPANAESTYISALILALIITPLTSWNDLWFLGWAGVWAMASKYIVAIDRKHIFNPVAFAVALTYVTINQSASWWVGDAPMLPFVLIGGVIVLRKISRTDLVLSFLVTTLTTTLAASIVTGDNFFTAVQRSMLYAPLFFFAFVILTEPLTTPPTASLQILYGALVGFLFSPEIHFGPFYMTPEIAILVGNVLSYIVSPKRALVLQLVRRAQLAPDIYNFIFSPERKLAYVPGQYMEWTLGHADPDSRGNRRYFTLASSPTEDQIMLGVRFHDPGSTFKDAMLSMDGDTEIVATHLAGDFTLPRDPKTPLVFIAGGIGVTPFRSMIKYLLDTRQKRPVVLFYASRSVDEIIYKDVFDRAQRELGIKTIYSVTDTRNVPLAWKGRTGYFTAAMIKAEVPNYRDCLFYVSGPKGMVDSFKDLLKELQVDESHVRTDYFSGLA